MFDPNSSTPVPPVGIKCNYQIIPTASLNRFLITSDLLLSIFKIHEKVMDTIFHVCHYDNVLSHNVIFELNIVKPVIPFQYGPL